MRDWAIGLSTGCFYQKSIFDCLETIGSGGFNLVEICSFPAHLNYHDTGAVHRAAERMASIGIEAYSFHAPFADHIDITSLDAQRREQGVKEVLVAAEAAAVLRARHFVIHPGPEHALYPTGDERWWRLEHVARSLSTIATRCQELGVLCVLENKLSHLLFGNIPDMMWILGAMTTTHVGVCLDTGHAYLARNLDSAMHKLAGYLKMVHASDNSGHHDDHLPPGEGHIDWVNVLRKLDDSGFQGSIMLEIAGRGEPHEVMAAARKARRYLRDQERKL